MNKLPGELRAELETIFGKQGLLDDAASLVLFAQDIFCRELPAGLVIRPQTPGQLAAGVRCLTRAGHAVIARGGGMSYTRAYVPTEAGSVMVDTSSLNEILEINQQDMYVRVAAGCTWKALHEALRPLGLRTPFWGPLSGIRATVGGSVSQSSVYWGAGLFGASADSVISLEVVLADGSILNTGSAAQQNGAPFFRHFGPDLTGIFCCDCGALGIKTSVTLRLLPEFEAVEHVSFDFAECPAQLTAMSQIARENLVAQMFGTDPTLNTVRAQRDSIMNDLKALGRVLRQADSAGDAIGKAGRMALHGRSAVQDSNYPIHATVEERSKAAARAAVARVAKICLRHGGKKIDNSVPTLLRASPFNPLNNIVGPQGERWAPIHALLPHSQVLDCVSRVQALYHEHRARIEQFEVQCGFLFTTVSTNCFFIEPLFFWPDELNELHRNTVQESVLRRQQGFAANPEARRFIDTLRQRLALLFSEMGAAHLQIGKEYHYRQALRAPARTLIENIKHLVDPERRINPGALGL